MGENDLRISKLDNRGEVFKLSLTREEARTLWVAMNWIPVFTEGLTDDYLRGYNITRTLLENLRSDICYAFSQSGTLTLRG